MMLRNVACLRGRHCEFLVRGIALRNIGVDNEVRGSMILDGLCWDPRRKFTSWLAPVLLAKATIARMVATWTKTGNAETLTVPGWDVKQTDAVQRVQLHGHDVFESASCDTVLGRRLHLGLRRERLTLLLKIAFTLTNPVRAVDLLWFLIVAFITLVHGLQRRTSVSNLTMICKKKKKTTQNSLFYPWNWRA